MGKGVWGIDVSKFSIKVVKLEGVAAAPQLTHVSVHPYEGTSTGEPIDLDAQIRSTLRDVKEGCRIGNDPVVFSLPSHSTFNRLIKLPPVDDAKIPEIVPFEAKNQIPFPLEEVYWDYQYVERTYQPGEEKEIILFAIKRDIVDQFLANIEEIGFNIEAVQFAPVALFNFLLKDQEISGACVALDMGGDNTDLIVLDGNKFWVRNLPVTGNNITKELQKAFNIPFDEAEKLKLKAGQSQQAQKIFNAIQPVLRELVNEINRSMGYYKSISKISKFEKILLLGNSTRTLNFQKFVSQSLQLNAARVQKLNTIGVGGGVDQGELNESLGTMGTALGLALQAVMPTVNRVNLLPPVFRQRKELKKKQPFIVAAVAALYVLVGVMWYTQSDAVEGLKKQNARALDAQKLARGQQEKFEGAKKVDDVRQQLEPLVAVSSERDLILKIMDEINPNIPDNGSFDFDPNQKLWVVDWKFEEIERKLAPPPAPAPAPGAPPAPPPAPTKEGAGRTLWSTKWVQAVLEVCITKRKNVGDGQNFIVRTLLNYNAQGTRGAIAPAPKGCVIKNKNWELFENNSDDKGYWSVEHDNTEGDLEWPVPKGFPPPEKPGPEDKKYWRFRVTLKVPVGEDQRKTVAVADPKGEKK